jgi:tRNA pseudouridine65 synthase
VLKLLKLPILFECDDFIIINKPSGLHVHPGPEARAEKVFVTTLLKQHTQRTLFPVHRLDRATSGTLIIAYNAEAAAAFQQLLQEHHIEKTYHALVKGHLTYTGSINRPLTDLKTGIAKDCLTTIETLELFPHCTLIAARPQTGRRHQIRRHLAGLGHQLIGDTTYGKGEINRTFRTQYQLHRLFLHASALKFNWNNQAIAVAAPMPDELEQCLQALRSGRLIGSAT